MSEQSFILPNQKAGLLAFLERLPGNVKWKVSVVRYAKRRSDQQNRYLWGCVYPTIVSSGGEQLRGWSADDLHEYFLGEIFGWETLEGFGRKRLRPIKRSSKMTTNEFADYVEQIQQRMAEMGIYIPGPNE